VNNTHTSFSFRFVSLSPFADNDSRLVNKLAQLYKP